MCPISLSIYFPSSILTLLKKDLRIRKGDTAVFKQKRIRVDYE